MGQLYNKIGLFQFYAIQAIFSSLMKQENFMIFRYSHREFHVSLLNCSSPSLLTLLSRANPFRKEFILERVQVVLLCPIKRVPMLIILCSLGNVILTLITRVC